ncbi:MAG: SelT/SelW/SelH family protein [bacterium]|nr:SelT/SelW/SelH family protein [bacterium]
MAAAIKEHCGIESHLLASGGGVFEVEIDGELVFSKKALDRFPDDQEIIDLINQTD